MTRIAAVIVPTIAFVASASLMALMVWSFIVFLFAMAN